MQLALQFEAQGHETLKQSKQRVEQTGKTDAGELRQLGLAVVDCGLQLKCCTWTLGRAAAQALARYQTAPCSM